MNEKQKYPHRSDTGHLDMRASGEAACSCHLVSEHGQSIRHFFKAVHVRHLADVGLMLDHRRRRWANIKPTSGQ